jgi:uncharacterized protein (DUF433 family)
MDYKEHIISQPDIMLGKPVIKNSRITVESILKRLSEGASIADLLIAYPGVTMEEITSVCAYAADVS